MKPKVEAAGTATACFSVRWKLLASDVLTVAIGSIVVPFGGSYLESHKVITKRNY